MIHVLVVPEIDEFKESVSHEDTILINLSLGNPKLKHWNARYVAPCWIYGSEPGIRRIYHILDVSNDGQSTVLKLGNSFLLDKVWNGMGQSRRFEYHGLKYFGFVDVQEGFLMKYTI